MSSIIEYVDTSRQVVVGIEAVWAEKVERKIISEVAEPAFKNHGHKVWCI